MGVTHGVLNIILWDHALLWHKSTDNLCPQVLILHEFLKTRLHGPSWVGIVRHDFYGGVTYHVLNIILCNRTLLWHKLTDNLCPQVLILHEFLKRLHGPSWVGIVHYDYFMGGHSPCPQYNPL